MESSFKKEYERQVMMDGSIQVTFRSKAVGAHAKSGFGALSLILFPVSCAITSPVPYKMIASDANGADKSEALLVWNFLAIAIWLGVLWIYNNRQSKLIIKPRQGVVFGAKQLPYAEIDELGTMTESTRNHPVGTAYVYAKTNGREVKLTKYVPQALAEAILREITNGR